MSLTRRDAICASFKGAGAALAGLSVGVLTREDGIGSEPKPPAPWPDSLVERPLREGFPAPLPLNPDGSAPEHAASEAGPITDPLMWRTPNRQAPEIEHRLPEDRDQGGHAGAGQARRHAALSPISRSCRACRRRSSCNAAPPILGASSPGPACGSRTSPTCSVSCLARITAGFVASDRHYVDEARCHACAIRR